MNFKNSSSCVPSDENYNNSNISNVPQQQPCDSDSISGSIGDCQKSEQLVMEFHAMCVVDEGDGNNDTDDFVQSLTTETGSWATLSNRSCNRSFLQPTHFTSSNSNTRKSVDKLNVSLNSLCISSESFRGVAERAWKSRATATSNNYNILHNSTKKSISKKTSRTVSKYRNSGNNSNNCGISSHLNIPTLPLVMSPYRRHNSNSLPPPPPCMNDDPVSGSNNSSIRLSYRSDFVAKQQCKQYMIKKSSIPQLNNSNSSRRHHYAPVALRPRLRRFFRGKVLFDSTNTYHHRKTNVSSSAATFEKKFIPIQHQPDNISSSDSTSCSPMMIKQPQNATVHSPLSNYITTTTVKSMQNKRLDSRDQQPDPRRRYPWNAALLKSAVSTTSSSCTPHRQQDEYARRMVMNAPVLQSSCRDQMRMFSPPSSSSSQQLPQFRPIVHNNNNTNNSVFGVATSSSSYSESDFRTPPSNPISRKTVRPVPYATNTSATLNHNSANSNDAHHQLFLPVFAAS